MALSVTLNRTSFTEEQLIQDAKPKIVFAGRSNVGKSSLLNALFGQKIAKISSTPGKTQSINYYELQTYQGYLVDLPGYGYAKASLTKRQIWSQLLDTFFNISTNITLVCILIDSRLPPQAKDLEMISYSQNKNLPLMGILTKIDKCKKNEIKQQLNLFSTIFKSTLIATSAKEKSGVDILAKTILATFTQMPPLNPS